MTKLRIKKEVSGIYLIVLFIIAMVSPAFSGKEEPATAMGIAETQSDSLAIAESEALFEKATASYKQLKTIQYDGITEGELYPRALSVYKDAIAAIMAPKSNMNDIDRFRGILMDLSGLLMKGSMYYSSENNMENMATYATAYVDIRLNPLMKDVNFGNQGSNVYPSIVYVAASSAYNSGEYERAIGYLLEYLNTGATDRKEQVSMYLGQACINAKKPELGHDKLMDAVNIYPANFTLLMFTLQNCLDGGYLDQMQPLLDKALQLHPDDEQLLSVQARLYENQSDFSSALDMFQRLYEKKPNSLSVNQHLALCYYNLGADYYNKALMESDDKNSKKYMRQASAYLSSASDKLALVVENDPTNIKYLRALAITYGCLGKKTDLDEINTRLVALGETAMVMNGMPESIVFSDQVKSQSGSAQDIPGFQEFAQKYVEAELSEWSKRQEFEKTEAYEKRVTADNVNQEYKRLCKNAEVEYIKKYSGRLRISDLSLKPYDSDNESYLIESAMGPMVVKVPIKNKEAEAFKLSWNSIQLRNAKYYIKDNYVAIASVEMVTSAGKSYTYNAENAANYDYTDVVLDVNSILEQGRAEAGRTGGNTSVRKDVVIRAKSDVDRDIPVTSRKSTKSVALIMANENYKNVTLVSSALNDGETFSKYCKNTLGIPESQVMLYENLTYAEMLGAMQKLGKLVDALGEGVDVIVYYAGHGFPDEGSKDAYLLPVDGDGYTTAVSYPLKKLYSDLSAMRATNVMVFLDACFSGSTRDGNMLAEARGVALKANQVEPTGNMYILSAASEQETALPYKEKNHGLFTYYLLKKIQETKGNVSLQELSTYVVENVKKNSLIVNNKLQTPTAKVSGRLASEWNTKKLRP